jgi:hypothetical protein
MPGAGRRASADGRHQLLAAVVFGVVGRRLVSMFLRVDLMALGGVGVVRGLLVVARLVMCGGVLVVLRRLLVVLGGLLVRRCGFLRHGRGPFLEWNA